HAHIGWVVRIELERNLAVPLAAIADEHGFRKSEWIKRGLIDLPSERRHLLRRERQRDHARVDRQEEYFRNRYTLAAAAEGRPDAGPVRVGIVEREWRVLDVEHRVGGLAVGDEDRLGPGLALDLA